MFVTNEFVLAPADLEAELHAVFLMGARPVWAGLLDRGNGKNFQVVVLRGWFGQSCLLFTSCNGTATDGNVVAGSIYVEVSLAELVVVWCDIWRISVS